MRTVEKTLAKISLMTVLMSTLSSPALAHLTRNSIVGAISEREDKLDGQLADLKKPSRNPAQEASAKAIRDARLARDNAEIQEERERKASLERVRRDTSDHKHVSSSGIVPPSTTSTAAAEKIAREHRLAEGVTEARPTKSSTGSKTLSEFPVVPKVESATTASGRTVPEELALQQEKGTEALLAKLKASSKGTEKQAEIAKSAAPAVSGKSPASSVPKLAAVLPPRAKASEVLGRASAVPVGPVAQVAPGSTSGSTSGSTWTEDPRATATPAPAATRPEVKVIAQDTRDWQPTSLEALGELKIGYEIRGTGPGRTLVFLGRIPKSVEKGIQFRGRFEGKDFVIDVLTSSAFRQKMSQSVDCNLEECTSLSQSKSAKFDFSSSYDKVVFPQDREFRVRYFTEDKNVDPESSEADKKLYKPLLSYKSQALEDREREAAETRTFVGEFQKNLNILVNCTNNLDLQVISSKWLRDSEDVMNRYNLSLSDEIRNLMDRALSAKDLADMLEELKNSSVEKAQKLVDALLRRAKKYPDEADTIVEAVTKFAFRYTTVKKKDFDGLAQAKELLQSIEEAAEDITLSDKVLNFISDEKTALMGLMLRREAGKGSYSDGKLQLVLQELGQEYQRYQQQAIESCAPFSQTADQMGCANAATAMNRLSNMARDAVQQATWVDRQKAQAQMSQAWGQPQFGQMGYTSGFGGGYSSMPGMMGYQQQQSVPSFGPQSMGMSPMNSFGTMPGMLPNSGGAAWSGGQFGAPSSWSNPGFSSPMSGWPGRSS